MQMENFVSFFGELEDPRRDHATKLHQLIDIIAIAVLGVICGAQAFTEIEDFGRAHENWLKTFLDLPYGVPSHDTFARVFARIDPKKLHDCLHDIISSLFQKTERDHVAIDGKTMRHSFDNQRDQKALHIVSAWSTVNQISLGQIKAL